MASESQKFRKALAEAMKKGPVNITEGFKPDDSDETKNVEIKKRDAIDSFLDGLTDDE